MTPLRMEFSPEGKLSFPYTPNKHLVSNLNMVNKNDFPIVYKFKASTLNRFVIRPNQGCLKPNESLDVQVVLHKDGVPNHQNEKIQVVYGPTYDDAESKFYSLQVEEYSSNQKLDLEVLVQEKQNRIKTLEAELSNYSANSSGRAMGENSEKTKTTLGFKHLILVVLVGFLVGFFFPIRMFRKNEPLSMFAQKDIEVLEKEVSSE